MCSHTHRQVTIIQCSDITQAESVSHHLSAPVLRHSSLKPSYACIKSIRAYFASLPRPVRDEELIVVGDRLLTDIVMANRMSRRASPPSLPHSDGTTAEKTEKSRLLEDDGVLARPGRVGPLAVWTEGLWKRENLALRALERGLLKGVERWVLQPQEAAWRESLQHRFVRPLPVTEDVNVKEGWVRRLVRSFSSRS